MSIISSNDVSDTSICTVCGTAIQLGSKFCGECGALQTNAVSDEPIKCITCGFELSKNACFCSECGAVLTSKPLDAVAPLIPSEEPSIRPDLIALSPNDEGLPISSPPEGAVMEAMPKGGRVPLPLLLLGGLIAVIIVVMIVRNSKSPQPNQSSVENSPQSAAPRLRIITKDPEWARLLHPPTGEDDILANSRAYVQKKQEIEVKLSQISDPELRERVSSEEWGKVDKQSYMAEGEETLRASEAAAMKSFLERHRTDWFEIGHVDYPGSGSLRVKSVDASPLEVPDGEMVPMNISTMDSVYSKFREAAKPAIKAGVDNWMYEQTCNAHLKNVCENLGGAPSECSDPAKLRDIEQQLGSGGILTGCNDHPSAETGRRIIEKQVRESRLVLVGQGDLPSHRIDKLLLVDYDTEAALLELPPNALTGVLRWKASVDLLSPKPSPSELSSTWQDTLPDAQNPVHPQSDDEQSVKEAVESWANAFRSRDAERFAACYAPEVEQFFRKKDVSRSRIHDTYQMAFGKMDNIYAYAISDLRVAFPEGETSPSRATATYDKTWDTSQTNGKRNSGEEVERLTFEKTGVGWRIVREEELNIIRAHTEASLQLKAIPKRNERSLTTSGALKYAQKDFNPGTVSAPKTDLEPGAGPSDEDRNGSTGDGLRRVGDGVSSPKAIFQPEIKYSEEAQGNRMNVCCWLG